MDTKNKILFIEFNFRVNIQKYLVLAKKNYCYYENLKILPVNLHSFMRSFVWLDPDYSLPNSRAKGCADIEDNF